MRCPAPESLTIRPDPRAWHPRREGDASGAPAGDGFSRSTFRAQLNLPAGRPVIMTGHQPQFWHPGILAKYLAADAFATESRAPKSRASRATEIGSAISVPPALAWIVVDQSRPASLEVRYPAHAGPASPRLLARSILFTHDHTPDLPDDPAAPFVRDGLARIIAAMRRAAEVGSATPARPSLALQVGAATASLLRPLLRSPEAPTLLTATDLARTDLFREFTDLMRRDPEACIRAYNTAAARHPSAGIRPLLADDVQYRYELPLWHLPPGAPRRRVYADDLDAIPAGELAPRALLMTGLLRLGACDLFIHGTGGGGEDDHEGYDVLTEEWLRDWLGLDRRRLAPISVVTATRYLPLSADPPPTPAEVARARWAAHHARHDPGRLGDEHAARLKMALVREIDRTPDRHHRRGLFRTMHEQLDAFRARRADDLAGLEARAGDLQARRFDAALLCDRTWAFPLFPEASIAALRDEIDAAFSPAR